MHPVLSLAPTSADSGTRTSSRCTSAVQGIRRRFVGAALAVQASRGPAHLLDTARTMSEESTGPHHALPSQRVIQAGNARDIDTVLGFYASDSVYDRWTDGLIERTANIFDIDEARAAAERLAEERG